MDQPGVGLDGLVATLRELTADHVDVLVLASAGGARSARSAAAALGDDGVLVATLATSPLALTAIGQLLDEVRIRAGVGADVLAALLPAARSQLRAGAVLSGVSRLDFPVPSFRQHVRSLLPGARFLATTEPRATVTAAPPRGALAVRPGHRLVVAARGMSSGVVAAAGAAGHLVVPGEAQSSFWRARSFVEFCEAPATADQLLHIMGTSAWDACGWCGAHVLAHATACARCRQPRNPTRAEPEPPSPPSGAPTALPDPVEAEATAAHHPAGAF